MRDAPGEREWIRAVQERAGVVGRRAGVQLGIGDDCAILRPPVGTDVVVTTDFCLEGRHFRRDWHSAESAGHRCLARGLSDLAAMGARPLSAFLSIALPGTLRTTVAGRRWADGFLAGLLRLAKSTGTPLSGGDTAVAPENAVLADIVLVGTVPRHRALRRDGAKAGDGLYVTGALGGAAAELRALAARPGRFRGAMDDGGHPHLFPAPRLGVGQALVRRGLATAAVDVSDGVSTDLGHLCEASGVGAVLEAELVPVHKLAESLGDALDGGEDYELLFTARRGVRVPRLLGGVAVTRIGEITAGSGAVLREAGRERELVAGGWEHQV